LYSQARNKVKDACNGVFLAFLRVFMMGGVHFWFRWALPIVGFNGRCPSLVSMGVAHRWF
jgi:hypothetical protein